MADNAGSIAKLDVTDKIHRKTYGNYLFAYRSTGNAQNGVCQSSKHAAVDNVPVIGMFVVFNKKTWTAPDCGGVALLSQSEPYQSLRWNVA